MMHPDMAYQIATMRGEELARGLRAPRRARRSFWRRRDDAPRAAAATPVQLVPLPPPRQGHELAGPDRRVA